MAVSAGLWLNSGLALQNKAGRGEKTITAEDRILDAGYEDVIVLVGFAYDSALIGVTEDNQAVYDYDLMVEWLCQTEGWSEEESVEWIEFNVIRALPHMGKNPPVIMHRI